MQTKYIIVNVGGTKGRKLAKNTPRDERVPISFWRLPEGLSIVDESLQLTYTFSYFTFGG